MIKFELPEQMVMRIAQALGEQPYKMVADIVAEMNRQIEEQKKPKE